MFQQLEGVHGRLGSPVARRHRIAIVVPARFSLFELAVSIEAFTTAHELSDAARYDLTVCSAHPGCVHTVDGLVRASIMNGLEVVDDAETVIIPQADDEAFPATAEVVAAIQRAGARGARLVSAWTGVFVLAAAGVLDGRRAAVHWQLAERLRAAFPSVEVDSRALYRDDGNIITSAGNASGMDVGLHILRRDHGASVARDVAHSMVMAPHRAGEQAQDVSSRPQEGAGRPDGIATAMEYALSNLHTDLPLRELARAACMSTRHFSRRFHEVTGTSPARWVAVQKLDRAQALLEETDGLIECVAAAAGFASPVTFRQRFSRRFDMTPVEYRRAFRARRGTTPLVAKQVSALAGGEAACAVPC